MDQGKTKICYIAGREAAYSRTAIVKKGLEKAGFEVTGIFPTDKRFIHYPGLIWRFIRQKRQCELVVVGFYGQILMLFVRLLTRKPILYDVYISTHDTMIYDRQKARARSFKAWIYWCADHITLRWADAILLETMDHIHDYTTKFKVAKEKFKHVFLTVDNEAIAPAPHVNQAQRFMVHFHGEYAPFHGVRTILEAAYLLRNEDIEFEIIGTGITYDQNMALAKKLYLENVHFIDWIPYHELAESMLRAHCCLGIFGDNPRTQRVLTNKVVETLAVGRALITVKNQPVQELVRDGESALLVPPADPQALSEAILKLKNDPELCHRIAEAGHKQFLKFCTMDIFSNRLKDVVNQMVNGQEM